MTLATLSLAILIAVGIAAVMSAALWMFETVVRIVTEERE